ncbi:MAG: ATP-grasp domain-containing protein [Pyrinomonadaceae bacterium]|nr:ATP-grasp domain-containing protein [Pyrinomonadaceae bacterium]MBP6212477.1 ATP-grasp domain-containing protein [Pyrinomonadaceae bacterium]
MAKRPFQINTVFCLASYFKGNDFIRECKSLGHRVFLLTREVKLNDDWARESLDGVIPVDDNGTIASFLRSATKLAQTDKPTHIVALEEGDVITAGRLREHFGLPGMVSSQARLFRDKLAMRRQAAQSGIRQADFVHLLNYQDIGEFMERVKAPWVIKPRADASAIGIKKVYKSEQVWRLNDSLNENESLADRSDAYLMEEFIEGEIFHVDSLVVGGKAVVACANQYGISPLEVTVNGGVSTSHTIEYGSTEQKQLLNANQKVLSAFGFENGVTHAEFIKSKMNGEFYFLEVGARVGGAFTAEAFEAASGLNIWREWAKIEMADGKHVSAPKQTRFEYGGIVVSLAKQERPDTSAYTDPEICFRADVEHHVALVLRSPKIERMKELLETYTRRFSIDFMAFAPQQDRPE